MNRNKQIKSTDWLTKGYNKEELVKMKAEAIKEADAELRDKQIEEMAMSLAKNLAWDEDVIPTVDCLETAKQLYSEDYRKASEVAKEIFEKIENGYANFLFDGVRNVVVLTEEDYNELKNKYTEETRQ